MSILDEVGTLDEPRKDNWSRTMLLDMMVVARMAHSGALARNDGHTRLATTLQPEGKSNCKLRCKEDVGGEK